jgi:glucose/arabinose dehydrogenase
VRTLRLVAVLALVAACAGPTTTPQPPSGETPAVTSPGSPGGTPAATNTPTSSPAPAATGPAQGPTPAATTEPTTGPSLDLALTVEPFAEVDAPLTFFTHDDAGGHYAVGQDGVIYAVGLDATVAQEPFLDIEDRLISGGEQGLLGLAFHPDSAANGRFFVNYTNLDGDTVISEFTLDIDDRATVSPDSERILLTIQQPFPNHNGGMIAFGPDGYLYIGMGDGGSAGDPMGNGQARASLLGKMLRIDVDSGDPYGIPADNPFIDSDALPEIWSIGLRNPWRWSFDRLTGDLFIGDVGQDAAEEIDAEPAGESGRNYGWNTMEADLCFRTDPCDQTGLTMPIVSNHRERGECAIVGGYVYRGAAFPELNGTYIYSDNCTGDLWALDAAAALANGTAEPVLVGESDANPTSFGEDENGELYLVNGSGSIYKLVPERIRP